MTQQPHISVLLASVLDLLRGTTGTIVDATFGAGGYTRALLTQNPTCRVIAFDRDSKTVAPFAERINTDFPGRFTYVPDCFANLSHHITQPVEAIVADLGVSSMQIDTPDRGFSWRFEAPLDMRMGTQSLTAADIVNTYDEKQLADILYIYGEEKASRRIAKHIIQNRPVATTTQLADLVHQVMPRPKDGSDSAMRTFQALRIAVNDELNQLETFLEAVPNLLKPAGKLIVVSFHSLEDRIVKSFLQRHSKPAAHINKYAADTPADTSDNAIFSSISRKPVLPSPEELAANSRSHSAKLRWGVRA